MEDLAIRIDGVDHQVEQLLALGLKLLHAQPFLYLHFDEQCRSGLLVVFSKEISTLGVRVLIELDLQCADAQNIHRGGLELECTSLRCTCLDRTHRGAAKRTVLKFFDASDGRSSWRADFVF